LTTTEQVLWGHKAWNDYRESLVDLLDKILEVTERYYPAYMKNILKEDKLKHVKRMMPQKRFHREYHNATFLKGIESLEGYIFFLLFGFCCVVLV
jgi:hypothetical protein